MCKVAVIGYGVVGSGTVDKVPRSCCPSVCVL